MNYLYTGDIQKLGLDDLLSLDPKEIGDYNFQATDLIHIAKTLGAYWHYDYDAAYKWGKLGLHAELKSGVHSDEMFVSKILLKPTNILEIIAAEMARKIRGKLDNVRPDWIAGIPDGATKLGEAVAQSLYVKNIRMKKIRGRIIFDEDVPAISTGLFVEDFFTRGTGVVEAVKLLYEVQSNAKVLKYNPVILNRGGASTFYIPGIGTCWNLPLATRKANDWLVKDCPLCAMGSEAIKPKATDENWEAITTSQL